MGDFLAELIEWMAGLPPLWAYGTILVITYLENVVPPIPGDMIVVFGGYMAGLGILDPWIVILLATIGGSLGFMSIYAIGHKIGKGLMDDHRYRWLPRRRIEQVRAKLKRWGFSLIAANRFLSGLRSVISLTVGMAHMPVSKTVLWSSVSALVWCALLTWLGVFVGENWEVVNSYLRTYGIIVTIIIMIIVLVQWLRYRKSRQEGVSE
jgi:membrane protein DedA with SNARE-associated domain